MKGCSITGKGPLLTDRFISLRIGVSPMIGADGLFSFNSKLAVLVSEPDVQIKKGQTCPLNPGKSPPSHLASLSASV